MDSWYPKINKEGQVVSGSGSIWFRPSYKSNDGFKIADTGWTPGFLEDTIIFNNGISASLIEIGSWKLIGTINHAMGLIVSGGNNYVGSGAPHLYYRDYIGDGRSPSISKTGNNVAWLEKYHDEYVNIFHNMKKLPDGDGKPYIAPIFKVAVCDSALVWNVASDGKRKTFGYLFNNLKIVDVTVSEWEESEIVDTPKGPWIISTLQDGLAIRPFGSKKYHKYNGDFYGANGIFIDNQLVLVGSTNAGQPLTLLIDINTPIPDSPDPIEKDKPEIPPIKPPEESPKMKLPINIQNTVRVFYNAHLDLAKSVDDNQRRELMKLIIEQVVFDNPNQGYGWKSADRNRPPSKDVLAKKEGDKLIGWDLFDGNTREPVNNPDSIDLPGQFFIEVTGVNHLKSDPGNEEPKPVPPDNPVPSDNPYASEELQKQQLMVLIQIVQGLKEQNESLIKGLAELKGQISSGIKIRF